MRWKAYFFEKDDNDESEIVENYGFKTEKTPPQDSALTAFENDLYELVHSIQFSNNCNQFQHRLKKDMKEINSSSSIFVPADKTTNLYNVSKEQYEKLLNENITATYKKADISVKKSIDLEAKKIAKNLKLDDKIECFTKNDAFITLKDHKDNFANNPKCRLINPAKSEIGIISKKHLERINSSIREKTVANQWRNTASVISWFNNIQSKKSCKFMQFDIVEFYPSISENLLRKALNFAVNIENIDETIINIIMHARKALLFEKDDIWVKKNGTLFDVTMGSFDGAEICDLVGLYLLNQMKGIFSEINLGLYRDDGLGCYRNMPGPATEQLKKKIIHFFHEHGLKITVDANLNQVDFLDVTFNLQNGKYWPFRKPNDKPLYIHKDSNHPPSIVKELPSMIEKRISDISCNEEEFNKVKNEYNKALSDSGFSHSIQYSERTPSRHNRKRNIIWFNPPFNNQVNTNVGKDFLHLVDKHFPLHHKFRKFFNRNTIKISYSCMPNVKSIISKHNKKILNSVANPPENLSNCNCRVKENCPLEGDCLEKSIVYKASVSTEECSKFYIGLTEPDFKSRFNNHTQSFRSRAKSNNTCLSKYVWNLKDHNLDYNIKWDLLCRAAPYGGGTRKCDLCLTEKLLILQSDTGSMVNKRSEILNKCRHGNKYKLMNIK